MPPIDENTRFSFKAAGLVSLLIFLMAASWKVSSFFSSFEQMRLETSQHFATIEKRLEDNGHYQPGNCEWVPRERQANNTRATRWVVFQGKQMSLADAARKAGVGYRWLFHRLLVRRLSIEDAINPSVAPLRKQPLSHLPRLTKIDEHPA
jgi:hypothetical protein